MASLHDMSDSGSDSDGIVGPSDENSQNSDGTIELSSEEDKKGGQNINNSASFHDVSDSDEDPVSQPSTSRAAPPHQPSGKKRKRSCEDDSTDAVPKPVCVYGRKCYRKNPSHLKEFCHPGDEDEGKDSKRTKKDPVASGSRGTGKKLTLAEKCERSSPVNFLLTHVTGINEKYNNQYGVSLSEILANPVGDLTRSVQFNYKIDIPWLVAQYPYQHRTKPLLVVHGAQREEKHALHFEAEPFTHVSLCQARLEMFYGTHHTKMMMLLYDSGLKVVIHTANLIHQDWHQKTQGVWISPLFPRSHDTQHSDSRTHFKRDLVEYLSAYKSRQIEDWVSIVREHDMSAAKVHLIASVPGRHTGEKKSSWGHMKLRRILSQEGPKYAQVRHWPVIGQFSSVGSMGAKKENWLSAEWQTSLSASKGGVLGSSSAGQLKLVFPCRENVRQSLEGYAAGGSLPYSINVAKKQPFLHEYFHQWKADACGRSRASPHIKTYLRASPDNTQAAWLLCTSANLSKAAWGALEKSASQLMIRSYELGVLFLPSAFKSNCDVFNVKMDDDGGDDLKILVPFDLPLTPYRSQDRPWIWDIPCVDKPDTHGNKWCPS